jgi:hypothetical protein
LLLDSQPDPAIAADGLMSAQPATVVLLALERVE